MVVRPKIQVRKARAADREMICQMLSRAFWDKAVASHRFRQIDQEGACAHLESTMLTNVPLYRSWGFQELREIEVVSGMIFDAMWRETQQLTKIAGSEQHV